MSAYAEMFEERTGNEINQIVILVVTEDGVVQEFVKTKTTIFRYLWRLLTISLNIGKEKKMKWFIIIIMTQPNSVGQPETPLYIPFMEFADKKMHDFCKE